jgi:hypothetical protein
LKDRWNREVERGVRWVYETDWEERRVWAEEKMGEAWNKLRSTEKAQELEQRFKENVVGVEEGMKGKVDEVKKGSRQPRLLEEKI